MKKNKMMRVASALLVAVLMTTSVISGTFAKYVTQDSASDTARVAKWGVELQVVGNLFGDTYGASDAIVNSSEFTVKSNQTVDGSLVDVVAPGTKNVNGFAISLKGQPEVAGKVTTTMTIQNIFLAKNTYAVMVQIPDNIVTEGNYNEMKAELFIKSGDTFVAAPSTWDDGYTGKFYTCEDKLEDNDFGENAKYYPVVYTLKDGETTIASGNTTADSLKVVADTIANAAYLGLTAGTPATDTSITYTGTPKEFDANTNLADWNCDGLKLTWAWAFGTAGAPATFADKADTILGLIENTSANATVVKLATNDNGTPADPSDDTTYFTTLTEYTDYCLDTMFSIDITVEQVD